MSAPSVQQPHSTIPEHVRAGRLIPGIEAAASSEIRGMGKSVIGTRIQWCWWQFPARCSVQRVGALTLRPRLESRQDRVMSQFEYGSPSPLGLIGAYCGR